MNSVRLGEPKVVRPRGRYGIPIHDVYLSIPSSLHVYLLHLKNVIKINDYGYFT